MPLDHSAGCVNYRDVGDFLAVLGDDRLPPGRLLRGGKLTFVEDWADIDRAATIINLRGGPDPTRFDAAYRHHPRPNNLSTYDTADRGVRRWLCAVLAEIAEADLPVMLHCTSGKDRTGVAVAAVLMVLGVHRSRIVEEYLLSDGEVRREWIGSALDGMGDLNRYFDRVDLGKLHRRLLEQPA
ncbi:MAG: protein-tyrosine phosphatase [Myxococcota bacterium]|jgi:protein-tyrosine phosphatase